MTRGSPGVVPPRSVWRRLVRLIPTGLRTRLRGAAPLPWGARAVFTARWLSGTPDRRPSVTPGWTRHLLFVCHGNLIRSPLAAALCRREALRQGVQVEVVSAGLHPAPGTGADPRAAGAAQSLGVSLEGHRSRPLTAAVVRDADLVLVMDFANDAELIARFPGAWRKVRLLGAFVGNGSVIADPYAADAAAVRASADRIQDAVRELVRCLTVPAGT